MQLSPIDHVFASDALDPIQFTLTYEGRLDAGRLEDAFHATARDFHGSNATLVALNDSTLTFDLSADAAEFQFVSFQGRAPPSWECVPPISTALGLPLTRARLTEVGGTTILGLSMSHVVADGYGYFFFLSAWAMRARGEEAPRPACDRSVLRPPALDDRPPESPNVGPSGLGFFLSEEHAESDEPPRRRFVPREMPATKSTEGRTLYQGLPLSHNDLLCALLWQEEVGPAPPAAETTLAVAVDLRRHHRALTPLYFGNALLLATVTMDTSELQRSSTEAVAARIRRAVDAVPARVGAVLANLEHHRRVCGLGMLRRFRTIEPRTGFAVSNLSRVPVSSIDFGTGAPARLELASASLRGRGCVVLPPLGDSGNRLLAAR